MTKPGLSFFKPGPTCWYPDRFWATVHDVLKLASEQLKISSNTNSYPLLLTDKTNTHCSLRNYHETVLSDILHDGNKACLYNHKIIACWYFLIQQAWQSLEQKH